MGISAKQHCVCIGMFHRYNCKLLRRVTVDRGVCSGNLSRHVFGVCIGIIYFYILTFIFFMTIDCGNGISRTNHSSIYALPNYRSFMNLYFIITCMYVYESDNFGIKTLTGDLVSRFLKRPSRVKITLALAPE